MLQKIRLALVALLLPLVAFGQSYPSPTFNNVTVQGTLTAGSQSFTNPLPVASGGTGLATLTANAVLVGAGTGNITLVGPGTNGQMLLGVTGAAPAWGNNPTIGGGTINNTPVGATTASTGAFTTLSASGTVSGAGFTSLLSPYCPIASCAMTGTPTAPTGTTGVSSTQIATQAFVINSAGTGRLIGVQVFTSSGTYTPDTGTNSVIEELVGAGGGGGGIVAMPSGNGGASACGGAGGYVKSRLTSGFSGLTITIGAAGTGGTTAGAAGGTGGNTSDGTRTASGGVGGGGVSSASAGPSNLIGGGGGAATGGNIVNVPGQAATVANYGVSANYAVYGTGGSTMYGSGSQTVLNATGVAGKGYGSGGCGTIGTSATDTAYGGGAGGGGLGLFWEYN